MQKIELYYDNVVNVVFDNYGKEYEVKEAKGNWKYINKGNEKISLSKIQTKILIRDFRDVVTHYILDWHSSHPCPAIGYSVYRKLTGKKIRLKDYYKQYKQP